MAESDDRAGATRDESSQAEVIAFLRDQLSRETGGAEIKRVDTHGAIVLLAGDRVYKVKRDVRFPFMDFSTLEKRRLACETEIAVNRDNAPNIYLDALPVVRADGGYALGGSGDPIEWVVRMTRFDEDATLDRFAARDAITPTLIADLALVIAAAHERAPRRVDFDFRDALHLYLDQNDRAFADAPHVFNDGERRRLNALSDAAMALASPLLVARQVDGYVRRCHGDLHLGNIAVIDGHPTLFDAIEFDETIATCDVLYDVAFALMDLADKGPRWSANLLLNRYLWAANDDRHFGALSALPLFLSARAAIRSKVTLAAAAHQSGDGRRRAIEDALRYFRLAMLMLTPTAPRLIAIGGLSGAGKSHVSADLAPRFGGALGAVWLRSDIERKAMFHAAETARLPPEAYAREATAEVYARLRRRADAALSAGQTVIVDAVHASVAERDAIAAVAATRDVPFTGVWLDAPPDVREERVSKRVNDASDANASIARAQSSYDIGRVDWRRFDAARDVGRTVESILEIE